jgi:phytoene dehydrogenase-like protein
VKSAYDVVVIGSGPNGLSAAIVAVQRRLSTLVVEANDTIGGGLRSAELTLPGFVHDVCASVHPMGISSPFFRSLPLGHHGFEWIVPGAAAAHPLDSGDATILWNDVERTAAGLGADAGRWKRGIGAVARDWPILEPDVLAPIGIPRNPLAFTRMALPGLLPADSYARLAFSGERARALFAGVAAHSILPFSSISSAAIGIVLSAVGHARGWPVARGGSQSLANALVAHYQSLGGEIATGIRIERHEQLPKAEQYFFDTSPRAMARILNPRLPDGFRHSLERYRYGPGVFKLDWALREPIPWADRECLQSATVHVGGTLSEIAAAEAAPARGEHAERPFVLVTQPSVVDATRAPTGRHTAWGYCHVPNGSTVDMTARIEAQMERFAPGFRDVVIGRAVRSPAELEADNANLVGGDVGGGSNDLMNLIFRPTWRRYTTPEHNVHLCSAATPPGAGIHGMCGYHAAIRALGKD